MIGFYHPSISDHRKAEDYFSYPPHAFCLVALPPTPLCSWFIGSVECHWSFQHYSTADFTLLCVGPSETASLQKKQLRPKKNPYSRGWVFSYNCDKKVVTKSLHPHTKFTETSEGLNFCSFEPGFFFSLFWAWTCKLLPKSISSEQFVNNPNH